LHAELKKEIDVGFINQYGIWTCTTPEVSAENVIKAYDEFKEAWGIPMQVGEHGWTTDDQSGKIMGSSGCDINYATEEHAATYYKTLHDLDEKRSAKNKVPMYAFQVQDMLFRGEGGWGILNEKFEIKKGYANMTLSGGEPITLDVSQGDGAAADDDDDDGDSNSGKDGKEKGDNEKPSSSSSATSLSLSLASSAVVAVVACALGV